MLDQIIENVKHDGICIGIDGCKEGWIAAVIDKGELRIEKYYNIGELVFKNQVFDRMLIDMVIGLPANIMQYENRPDSAARKLIAPRTSTVFPVPSRQAVYGESEEAQAAANKLAVGKGLSKQAIAIIPKIREVDEFLAANETYKNVIRESHPEVCFARLKGAVVMTKKRSYEGFTERVKILSQFLPELSGELITDRAKKFSCNSDDIVDAICLAVTANLDLQGKGEIIPGKVGMDDTGLRMQMVIPKEKESRRAESEKNTSEHESADGRTEFRQYADFYKSIIEQDRSAVVICNPEHEIIYMNPAAVKNYAKRGGNKLIGRSVLACHSAESQKKIKQVVEWFASSPDHNIVYLHHDKRRNKDVYMVALRAEGRLIGYYEKHEFRNKETMNSYDLW